MQRAHRWIRIARWGLIIMLLGGLTGCRQGSTSSARTQAKTPSRTTPAAPRAHTGDPALVLAATSSAPKKGTPGAIGSNHWIGRPVAQGNLAVFPIYARKQPDLGRFTTLAEALAAGTGVVREVRANKAQQRLVPQRQSQSNVQRPRPTGSSMLINADNNVAGNPRRGGARVNRLVIDNQGKLPILVLAGTVVKGGKQDRQIAQDFVVGPGKQVAVEAFCVERGRWNGNRAGKATGGRFTTVDSLANVEVRNAGQHKSSQSLVWQKVADTNRDNAVKSGSGTLMATLDNRELRRQRQQLLARIGKRLNRVPGQRSIVGLAYAVEGRVRSVRWFFNHAVFLKFKRALLTTAALEAMTAQARRIRKGAESKKIKQATLKGVTEFIASFRNPTRKHRRTTNGMNDNYYRRNPQGFQSTTVLRSKGVGNPVSVDFSAK